MRRIKNLYTTKDGILTIKEKDGKGDEKLTFKK